MSPGTMAGCRHQDSNLGRTNHTALNRARLTTLAWRRNSKIANDSATHFGTQRRESDSNTRVLADAAIPAQSLDQARETPPTVRRRVERRRREPPPCSRLRGDATSEVSRLSVSNRAPSPIRLSHHHRRSLLRRARLALLIRTPEDAHCSASDPHSRGECAHQHPVTAGMDGGHLVPWKYAPSSVTQISTLPIVSMDVVSPSGT